MNNVGMVQCLPSILRQWTTIVVDDEWDRDLMWQQLVRLERRFAFSFDKFLCQLYVFPDNQPPCGKLPVDASWTKATIPLFFFDNDDDDNNNR